MNRTRIEYLDYTLNLINGCSGENCAVRKKCYAMKMAKRNLWKCSLCRAFEPHYHRERLNEPLALKKPSRIGLNFMGETFDKIIKDYCPYVWKEIFEMVEKAYWHTFVCWTKQPQNIPENMIFPKNLILGATVNRFVDKWRIGTLKTKKAEKQALSFEPLYESMFEKAEDKSHNILHGICWIVIGAQTNPDLQPKAEWVYELSHQASELGIPIFWKNNLTVTQGRRQEFPK